MKNFRLIALFTSIICVVIFISCSTTKSHTNTETLPDLPKISNPTFESYNYGSEKIYQVSFDFDESDYQPDEVVLFGVRQALRDSNIQGNTVNVDVIHQTQKLQGFQITPTELANGVIFKIDGVTYLKTVNFKNIKQ